MKTRLLSLLICACIVHASQAQSDGENGKDMAVLPLCVTIVIIGVVGAGAYVLIKSNECIKRHRCPECNRVLPEDAQQCPTCETDIDYCTSCDAVLPTDATECPKCETPVVHCPSCDEVVPPDANVCPGCGAALPANLQYVPRAAGEITLPTTSNIQISTNGINWETLYSQEWNPNWTPNVELFVVPSLNTWLEDHPEDPAEIRTWLVTNDWHSSAFFRTTEAY